MRALGAIVLALTMGASGFAIGMYRERATLLPRIECAYHTGSDEGYNAGRKDRGCVKIRKIGNGVEEIIPTECESPTTPRIPDTTQRSASR